MHEIVLDELERHLNGEASQAFHSHVAGCTSCRDEVAEIEEISRCLAELKPLDGIASEPSLGFYNRVASRIVDEQKREAWGLFSPGAQFFRRIAFASLVLLGCLGTFLIEREVPEPGAVNNDAVAIITQHDVSTVHPEDADRDRLLVTLATYHE